MQAFTEISATAAGAPLRFPASPTRRCATAFCRCRTSPGRAEVERATAHLYEKVKAVIAPIEWPFHAPYVKAINDLKKERNAVILAHNYQTPEIYNCVADVVGDSLQLARLAARSDGRHHRAGRRAFHGRDVETAQSGQDRADPGFARRLLAGRNRSPAPMSAVCGSAIPGVPVIAYVNTSAEVKAEVDICCTSSNAAESGRELRRGAGDLAARPLSRRQCRPPDQGEDHRLARGLRGARTLHGRGTPGLSRR